MGDEKCSSPLINEKQSSTMAARVMCGMAVALCGWAVVNMRRCKPYLAMVNIFAVGHVLVTHMLFAGLLIIGITFSGQVNSPESSALSDYIYLFVIILLWQEHMAYLLLAHISVVPSAPPDLAIMFIVVTWGMAASPALGLTVPYFRKSHHLECNSSLWQHSTHSAYDISELPVIIPSCIVLAILIATSIYHVAKADTMSEQMRITCKHCWECYKIRMTIRGVRLNRILILQFLLTSVPQVIYWANVLAPPVQNSPNYQWIMLSVDAALNSLAGIIVLILQLRLLSLRVIPCVPGHGKVSRYNGGDQHGIPHLSQDEEFYQRRMSSISRRSFCMDVRSSNGQFYNTRNPYCSCLHCMEHKVKADAAMAEKLAAHAATSLGKVATVSSLPSIIPKNTPKKSRDMLIYPN